MHLGVWKQWLFKAKSPERMAFAPTKAVEAAIPADIRDVLGRYFQTFANFKAARHLQTDTFIKEVFFATKQDPWDRSSVDEMETYIDAKNRLRLGLKSYEIDEFMMLDRSSSVVGVTRVFADNRKNRVLYFLQKENGAWRFHHIARFHQGVVLDKFRIREQTGFVIGSEKAAMLFLSSRHQQDMDTIAPGDYVHVEGYLEVEDQQSGELYYRIFRINRIH